MLSFNNKEENAPPNLPERLNTAKEMPSRFLCSPLDEVMFRRKPFYAAF